MVMKPKWVTLLPAHLRPDEKRVRQLDQLRVEFGIAHRALAMRVMSSAASTRKVQRHCLKGLMMQCPEASGKELVRMVLASRVRTAPGYYGMTDEDVDKAVQSISSFDELCDYIVSLDEREPAEPDPLGLGRIIDDILAAEETDRKEPAQSLIQSLERTYYELAKNHPDRDEHWVLANTWLGRYGSTRQAKDKGPEWAKFVAYKDSHQFSILKPPRSIRGLALFLVYKELGEEPALDYAIEFSRIMEPIMRSRECHVFLDKYKERNPRTWQENQVEQESPYSLYWFLKGVEFGQEHPEESERLRKEVLGAPGDGGPAPP